MTDKNLILSLDEYTPNQNGKIVNPKTGREVSYGGSTYKKLLQEKVISADGHALKSAVEEAKLKSNKAIDKAEKMLKKLNLKQLEEVDVLVKYLKTRLELNKE